MNKILGTCCFLAASANFLLGNAVVGAVCMTAGVALFVAPSKASE